MGFGRRAWLPEAFGKRSGLPRRALCSMYPRPPCDRLPPLHLGSARPACPRVGARCRCHAARGVGGGIPRPLASAPLAGPMMVDGSGTGPIVPAGGPIVSAAGYYHVQAPNCRECHELLVIACRAVRPALCACSSAACGCSSAARTILFWSVRRECTSFTGQTSPMVGFVRLLLIMQCLPCGSIT